MAIPYENITLSAIAAEFNCAETFSACAAAAGLPLTNIKMSDFAGLSQKLTGLSIFPEVVYDAAIAPNYCVGTFHLIVGGDSSGVTYTWTVISGGASVYSGQGTQTAKIRMNRGFAGAVVGTIQCVASYTGGSLTATASYEFEWEGGFDT